MIRIFFTIFYPISLIYSLFSMLLYVKENHKNILECADALGPFFTGAISLSKFVSYCVYRKELFAMINALKSITDTSECQRDG
jgi:hypothetical protein